jgi:sulfur carrier protein ThiS
MDNIEIELKLFHTLRKLLPHVNDDFTHRLSVPVETTIEEILKIIGVPEETPVVIFLNGKHVGKDITFSQDDVLSIMLPAGGG